MLQYENEIMLPDEVCEVLCIGKNTLYKLLNSGELIGYRVGRNWKIPRRSVIDFIIKKSKETLNKSTIEIIYGIYC